MKMQWNVLSEAEVQRIHELSLRILAETGLRITHAGVLRTLRARGARVDEPAERVRFPPELVRELLSQAPPVAVYEGINGF